MPPCALPGLFKAKTLPNGEITNDPPLFQMFQCLHAPGGGEGGRTMVTNGADVLNKGLNAAQREWLRGRRSISFTPKNQAFGGNLVNMPLIIHNDHTGHDVIRWLESW
jgi:alpha-ketoglutarate-dependent taurine dioxygenase